MTRLVLAALLTLPLVGCQYTEYYAEGVSIATRERDRAQCEAEARDAYPPLMETRFTPRVYHPGRVRCDGAGTCEVTPGFWEGGDRYRVDLNEDARDRAIAGCMGGRGYAQVRLPVCERGQTVAPSTVMAPLTAESCLLMTGGSAMFVTP